MAGTATSRDSRSARQIIRKALPLEKANLHNLTKGANTDFLASALSPSDPPCLFRIWVMLNVKSLFTARVTKASVVVTLEFNATEDLESDALYVFDLPMHTGDTVNFRAGDAQTGAYLRVQEIAWAVQ